MLRVWGWGCLVLLLKTRAHLSLQTCLSCFSSSAPVAFTSSFSSSSSLHSPEPKNVKGVHGGE